MAGKPRRDGLERALDEALVESFPASDPIAVHAAVEDQRSSRRTRAKPRKRTTSKARRKKAPANKRKAQGRKPRR